MLLIINQWVIASRADSLANGPAKLQALAWHKSFGITILALAIIRLSLALDESRSRRSPA